MATYEQVEEAKALARKLVEEAGFLDLFVNGFTVTTYTDEELSLPEYEDTDKDWVGQYVAHSIDSEHGLTVLVNVDKHVEMADLLDTMLHEIGHGLWELLDGKSRQEWEIEDEEYQWGAVEGFADTFMRMLQGERHLMECPELFERIVQIEGKQ